MSNEYIILLVLLALSYIGHNMSVFYAVGVILMIIVGIFTLVYFGCLQKKVHYQ